MRISLTARLDDLNAKGILVCVFAFVALACVRSQPWVRRDGGSVLTQPLFRLLPDGHATQTIDRVSSSGSHYAYEFVREKTGVETTLRAVIRGQRQAFVVGDRGVLLIRDQSSGWHRHALPTTKDLTAISISERCFAIVGREGTIIESNSFGKNWQIAESGTQVDLNVIAELKYHCFIAGAHGTLLARVASGWSPINTGVNEDLHAIWNCSGAICAAGDHGRVLRCVGAPPRMDCSTMQSPTSSDLLATTGDLLVGGDGTILKAAPDDSLGSIAQSVTKATLNAVAENHWLWSATDGSAVEAQALAVGSGGTAICISTTKAVAEPCNLRPNVDLLGVAADDLEWFVVGDGGLVLHGAVRSITIAALQNL